MGLRHPLVNIQLQNPNIEDGKILKSQPEYRLVQQIQIDPNIELNRGGHVT